VHLSNFEFVDGDFCQYIEPTTASNTNLAGQLCSSVTSHQVDYEDKLLQEVDFVLPAAELAHLPQCCWRRCTKLPRGFYKSQFQGEQLDAKEMPLDRMSVSGALQAEVRL